MNAAPALSMLIAALLAGAALGGLAVWVGGGRRKRLAPLPRDWTLAARRVLDADERRVYNQLRLAFPKHIVLPKLPLVRLCQPATPDRVQYWYELIGAAHVTFAVCNPNGHVLLAIDLDNSRSHSRRSTRIKESVLAACGIVRLHCAVDALPPLDALRALIHDSSARESIDVPASATSEQTLLAPVPAPTDAPEATPDAAALQPVAVSDSSADHNSSPATWQDANVFLDSFFTGDDKPASSPATEAASAVTNGPTAADSRYPAIDAIVNDDDADGIPWRRNAARVAGGR